MTIEDFHRTVDIWLTQLERYSFAEICAKPSLKSWSLGQVIMHLVAETNFYLEQINICISSNENSHEEATINAKMLFSKNALPDQIIEGPASNLLVSQAESKSQLQHSLRDLKDAFDEVSVQMLKSSFHGKSKHPGLGFFSASEWFQFAEMHLRHHLKQKERIDRFLHIKN